MKTCPYCAEQIQDAAIICRYCGRELSPTEVHKVKEQVAPHKPWYRQGWFYLLSFFILWPLFFLLVVTDRHASSWLKAMAWGYALLLCAFASLIMFGPSIPESFSSGDIYQSLGICSCSEGSADMLMSATPDTRFCAQGLAQHIGSDSFTLVFVQSPHQYLHVKMPRLWTLDFPTNTTVEVHGTITKEPDGDWLLIADDANGVLVCSTP